MPRAQTEVDGEPTVLRVPLEAAMMRALPPEARWRARAGCDALDFDPI
jgi:hypothetical protein